MPYLALSVMIQIALVTHVITTGRDRFWIWILVFAPFVGSIAYVLVELIPELLGAPFVRRLEANARRALDPGRELREAEAALEMTDAVDNRLRYARALIAHNRPAEALRMLEQAAADGHANDARLLAEIAAIAFAAGDPARCVDALDRARSLDKEVTRSADRHLLYARALEALNRIAEAADEYKALVGYYPGEEARFRFAEMLANQGEEAAAAALFEEIARRQRRTPSAYRSEQKEWIQQAIRRLEAMGRPATR